MGGGESEAAAFLCRTRQPEKELDLYLPACLPITPRKLALGRWLGFGMAAALGGELICARLFLGRSRLCFGVHCVAGARGSLNFGFLEPGREWRELQLSLLVLEGRALIHR